MAIPIPVAVTLTIPVPVAVSIAVPVSILIPVSIPLATLVPFLMPVAVARSRATSVSMTGTHFFLTFLYVRRRSTLLRTINNNTNVLGLLSTLY